MLMSTLLVTITVILLAVLMPLGAFTVYANPSAVVGRDVRAEAAKDGQGHHGTWLRKFGKATHAGDPSLTDTTSAVGVVTVVVPGAGQILSVTAQPISTNIGRIRPGTLGVGTFDLIFDDTATFAVLNAQVVTFLFEVKFTPA